MRHHPHRYLATILCCLATLLVPWTGPAWAAPALKGQSLAAGRYHTLVLRSDGTVWAFGDNQYGQLGVAANVGTTLPNPTPTQIPGLSDIVAVAAGAYHSLALRSDGSVWNWGLDATPTPQPVPGLVGIVAIAAGAAHNLALRADGTVWGFGANYAGQLGTMPPAPPQSSNLPPTPITGLTKVIAIAAGMAHSVALRADGTVWAFGSNQYGQLGNLTNVFVSEPNPTPTRVPGLSSVSAIAAGNLHTLVLRADRTVWAFGSNNLGQLGLPLSQAWMPVPQQVVGLSGATAIAAGAIHSLALRSDGTVWGWGEDFGQLGPPVSTEPQHARPTPLAVPGLPVSNAIAAGGGHTLALLAGGTVWAFGNNFFGQLGTPTANGAPDANVPTPAPVPSLDDVAQPPSFVPLVPARLLDTRVGASTIDGASAGEGPRAAGSITQLQVTGRGSVASDAGAVVLNVTVTQAQGSGFLTVWPCGEPRPVASSLNFTSGQTIANAVVVKAGVNGSVCIYTSAATELLVDADGYFRDGPPLTALVPARLLDTRVGASTIDGASAGEGPRAAGSITQLHVTGRGNVAPDATAVIVNLTVTQAQSPGYLTVWPCGEPQPNASSLNFTNGQTIANAVVVKTGVDGAVCIYTSAATELLVDTNGYFS